LAPTFALLFQTFSLGIFFFSSKKKNHREKKNPEKGGSLPLSFCSALSFWALASGLLFLAFCFKHFSLASSSSQAEEKKKKHKEKKNVVKGGSLPFFSCFCIWDEAFLLLSPLHIPSTLSSPPSSNLVSHVSSKFCATQV